MTRPNKLACALMTAAAEDAARVAANYRSLADGCVALRDALLDGDAEKMTVAMHQQMTIAMQTARNTQELMVKIVAVTASDPAVFDGLSAMVGEERLKVAVEGLSTEDLLAELEHHAAKCDDVGCSSHAILTEEIARRAPH